MLSQCLLLISLVACLESCRFCMQTCCFTSYSTPSRHQDTCHRAVQQGKADVQQQLEAAQKDMQDALKQTEKAKHERDVAKDLARTLLEEQASLKERLDSQSQAQKTADSQVFGSQPCQALHACCTGSRGSRRLHASSANALVPTACHRT